MSIEIIPAAMPIDQYELEDKLAMVKGLVETVQLDIMDNRFVKNRSWPYAPSGEYSDDFLDLIDESIGMPLWDEFDFEADLMIQNPDQSFDDWVLAGFKRIIVHIESFFTNGTLEESGKARFENFLKEARHRFPKDAENFLSVQLGLAINTTTALEIIYPYVEEFDFIQCMGIAEIGFQAQPFDDRVLEKISTLRAKYPELIISVDGGVSMDTASRLMEAGANRLVAGSAIFESTNIVEALEHFKQL